MWWSSVVRWADTTTVPVWPILVVAVIYFITQFCLDLREMWRDKK